MSPKCFSCKKFHVNRIIHDFDRQVNSFKKFGQFLVTKYFLENYFADTLIFNLKLIGLPRI